MIAAILPDTLIFKTNADWIEQPWVFTSNGAAENFAGCTIGGVHQWHEIGSAVSRRSSSSLRK